MLSGLVDSRKERITDLKNDRKDGHNELLGGQTLEIGPWLMIQRKLEEVLRPVLANTSNQVLLLKETSESVDDTVRKAVDPDEALSRESEKGKRRDYARVVAQELLPGVEERIRRVSKGRTGEGRFEDVRRRGGGGLRHGMCMGGRVVISSM